MAKSSVSLSEPAYQYLLDMILSAQLSPGDRISEAAIAEQFHISRTPVRDAMRRLASEGLIEIFPNRFAQVAEYTADQIRDTGVIRLTLDRLAVRLALIYGSQADFLELQNLAEQCLQASKLGDYAVQHKYDSDFHMRLTEISGNTQLISLQKELYLRTRFIMAHYPHSLIDEKKQIQDHFDIAQALMDQDKERALACITDNLMSFYNLKSAFPIDLY